MNISKTTIFVGFSTGIKLLSGLIISKFVSMSFGPSGLVLIGQLQNFTSVINTIATGGIQQGVTALIAKKDKDEKYIAQIVGTTFLISSFFCVATFITCFLFKSQLSWLIFDHDRYADLIVIASVCILFFAFNNFCFSIINGFKDVKKYAILNSVSSLIALLLTCGLIYWFSINGALFGIILHPVFVSGIMFFSLRKQYWLKNIQQHFKLNKELGKKLIPYSAMSLIGITSLPIALIIIRNFLLAKEGMVYTGYWEASWKISHYYMMVLTTGFGVYLLPTYSAITEKKLLRKEVFKSMKFVFLISATLALVLFLGKKYVLLILFDHSFLEVENYLGYQLAGDVVKITSWTVALLLQAKAKATTFILTQILFYGLYIGSIYLLHPYLSKDAVFIAYLANYVLYFAYITYSCRKILW